MTLVMVFLALNCFGDTAVLVLKNGKKMQLEEGYRVESGLVLFHNKGQLVQLPASLVDLEATAEATEQYHAKRRALLEYQPPPEKKNKPLPDDLFVADVSKPKDGDKTKQTYDFAEFQESSTPGDEDYFNLHDAWAVFNRGTVLEKDRRVSQNDRRVVSKLLSKLSESIWACKSSEKRRGNLDELAWEDRKRHLKKQLGQIREEADAKFQPLEQRFGLAKPPGGQP